MTTDKAKPLTAEQRTLMRAASHLLPDPGGEVVRSLLDELDRVNAELERLRADARRLDWVESEFDRAETLRSFNNGGLILDWYGERDIRAAIDAAQQEGTHDEQRS